VERNRKAGQNPPRVVAPFEEEETGGTASYLVSKKVKQSPLQAWTGPEGSRRLRLSDFKTFGTLTL